MYKKLNLVISIFYVIQIFTAKPALSQSGWQMQNHSFTNQSAVVDVFFFDANTGWACGQFGFLFKTTNGGLNWNHINLSNNFSYKTLCFINQNTGWIGLGSYILSQYRGLVIKTTNSGINWKLDTLSDENNIPNKITFFNSQTGWIAANGIYKTTNSGMNWIRYHIQGYENFDIRSIAFPDFNTGYCTGTFFNNYTGVQRDIISKSTNGGISWQNIREESSSSGSYRFYNDLQFLNNNTGYLCGNPPLKTTNGGMNWSNIMENTSYYSMHFINANTGWFGRWDYSAMTSNGGLSWINQPVPISALFHGVYFIDEQTGWGVGLNSGVTYPKIFKTTSGGFTSINQISTEIPKTSDLFQNYPNPFNPVTYFDFRIADFGLVKLTIFDVLGKEVEILLNRDLQPGSYKVDWDASVYPSGVYYYKLEVSPSTGSGRGFTETKKMILIK